MFALHIIDAYTRAGIKFRQVPVQMFIDVLIDANQPALQAHGKKAFERVDVLLRVHSKFEWTRGDVHTNTLEGFFSVLKRGLVGIYQHVDKKHLDRYLAEFDFRQNTRARLGINDVQREQIAVKGFAGKRLTYQTTNSAEA